MKHWQLLLILFALALPLAAQVNGNLQYIGDKAILQVWGDHYQRGYAQGYLFARPASPPTPTAARPQRCSTTRRRS